MTYEKAEAIAIGSSDYSETSRLLSFYTLEFGRTRALAKGAKRRYSKVIGHIDLFSHCQIVFAAGRDRLHILAEATGLEAFTGLRADLGRYYAACHAAELVNSMTAEEDPNRELFERFVGLLRVLDAGTAPALALFAFEANVLRLTGFMPELGACVSCGRRSRANEVAFSPSRGGVLCEACAPAEPGRVEKVSAGALSLLDRLARGRLTRLDRVRMAPGVAAQVRAFLNGYESFVIGRELRTASHLGKSGQPHC